MKLLIVLVKLQIVLVKLQIDFGEIANYNDFVSTMWSSLFVCGQLSFSCGFTTYLTFSTFVVFFWLNCGEELALT